MKKQDARAFGKDAQLAKIGMPSTGATKGASAPGLQRGLFAKNGNGIVENAIPTTTSWASSTVLGLQRGVYVKKVRTAPATDTNQNLEQAVENFTAQAIDNISVSQRSRMFSGVVV